MKKTTKNKKVTDALGKLDVVFIIDATGSMGMYIQEAKQRAADILKKIQEDGDLDINVGLIAYRDHPPQDYTFITRVTPIGKIDDFNSALATLEAAGGGDRPEAVLDGINELFNLKWRKDSDRVVYLIGDAPPHNPYPTGLTNEDLLEKLFEHKIEVNAHSIANAADTTAAFNVFVEATGGKISVGNAAQHTTGLYTDTLVGKSTLINSARKFMGGISGSLTCVTYTNAASLNYTDAVTVASSVGMSVEEMEATIDYMKKRDL